MVIERITLIDVHTLFAYRKAQAMSRVTVLSVETVTRPSHCDAICQVNCSFCADTLLIPEPFFSSLNVLLSAMTIRLWFYDPLTDWSDLRLISELFIHNFCTAGDKNLRASIASLCAGCSWTSVPTAPAVAKDFYWYQFQWYCKYFCLNQHQFQVPLSICTMVYISRQSFFSLCIPLYLFTFFISNRLKCICYDRHPLCQAQAQ